MSTATLTSETTLEITGKTYTVISSTNAQTRIQSQADDKVYDIEVCGERLECNCADFVNRRKGLPGQSACKHIQAVVDAGLMAQPIFRPEIPAPGLVEFNTKELKTALGILGKVAPKPNRCPKPILCNALFTTNTEGVPCLEATNLDCSVRFKLTSNGQEYNGAALVPVHKVADLLKSHKGDTSSLDLQHGSIRVNKSVAIEAPSDRDTRIFLAGILPPIISLSESAL